MAKDDVWATGPVWTSQAAVDWHFNSLLYTQPLPAASVSLVAVDGSISGGSEQRTTGRKLSEAFVLQPTSLFPVKTAPSLSGSCHLFFNHFRLHCSRRAINILMQSRWGDGVIGIHLNCFSQAHDNTASPYIWQVSSVSVCASVKHTQSPPSPLQHHHLRILTTSSQSTIPMAEALSS